MATKSIGLYIHVPFCVRKCNYCDFCSFDLKQVNWRKEYLDRLCDEIASYAGRNIRLDSIFIGGGTPSLLTPDEMRRIVAEVKKSFVIDADCEFTAEANPGTLDREKLLALVECGVNRLSMGLQSIHENELKILGRIHSFDDFVNSYMLARECGINNINIDLMYGIPEQSLDSFSKTLDRVLALMPDHLSLYGLILEEGTPFYDMKDRLPLPGEDRECDMYYLAADRLKQAGFSHYEISNYASPGRECRHNLKYWHCDEYIGVGLSAYSYFDGKRFGNTDEPTVYLSSNGIKYENEETLDPDSMAYEYVMLRLRLAEGFSLSEYKERFGCDFVLGRKAVISELVKVGYLHLSEDRISLTESGFYVSNAILNELI